MDTILSLLESISSSDLQRKKFLDALQGVQQDNASKGDVPDLPVVPSHPPAFGDDQLTAGKQHSSSNTSLEASVPHKNNLARYVPSHNVIARVSHPPSISGQAYHQLTKNN